MTYTEILAMLTANVNTEPTTAETIEPETLARLIVNSQNTD